MQSHCVAWRLNRSLFVALFLSSSLGCSDEGHRLGGAYDLLDDLRVGPCSEGTDIEPIDRMEDADGTIDPTAGRGGVWLSFNDETGKQQPSAKDETFAMTRLEPSRPGSRYAAQSRGGGFTVWGAGIGFELNNQQGYDASRYAGITFWARKAEDKTFILRMGLPTPATAPRGGQCPKGEDLTQCNDHFGADVPLTTELVRYSYAWADLEQGTYGDPRPESIDTSSIYSVHFQVGAYQDFDFVIDDIAFLCHPE